MNSYRSRTGITILQRSYKYIHCTRTAKSGNNDTNVHAMNKLKREFSVWRNPIMESQPRGISLDVNLYL